MILGVNGIGLESANPTITDGRDLPWLQDTESADTWNLWGIAYRDVVVLDEDGAVLGVFNLTTRSLSEPDNYDALRELLTP